MQSNKLRMAIRSTAAVAILGMAGQAGAVDFNAGDYEMSIYGFARLNASYDIDSNQASPFGTQSATFDGVATNDNDPTGHFGADALNSRIGVTATTPEGVNIKIEGDFRPGTLRIRHAYGEYNGVLAGQTWSNYNSFTGWTPTLDFDSNAGSAGNFNRNAQLRYTTGPLSVALEEPSANIVRGGVDDDGNFEKQAVAAISSTPALTARIENSAGGLSYTLGGLINQVSSEDGAVDDSQMAFAVFAGAGFAISDMVSIQGAVNFTDGANSYLWHSGSNFYGDSAYANGSDLETISGVGGQIGVSVGLGDGRSVNASYGTTSLDLDDAVADGAMTASEPETNQGLMVNYKWTPVKSVMMGVEYAFLSQETQGGNSGEANRVLFVAQYNF